MLYLIGLGLGDAKDITVKGLEIVRKCDFVFLESYTSVLISCSKADLEAFYGREVIVADRELVEQGAEQEILNRAKDKDVALLVVGDPFGATTHADLALRATDEMGIEVKAVHNASIMNAVGCVGLQLYTYGETVSIPFWTDDWEPESFLHKIKANKERKMHTLCLLDIKMKEQTVENLIKGRKIFEPPRFMSVNVACEQILAVGDDAINGDTPAVGVARIGSDTQKIISGTLEELRKAEFGEPLHSLIIAGDMHPLEQQAFDNFKLNK